MVSLQPVRFDLDRCRIELAEFKSFLDENNELDEKSILRFFRRRLQLTASVGAINPESRTIDRYAFEYPLFGNFACDLVVGDSAKPSYCFVEFEDARSNSIFVKRRRDVPEWASRFERGYSQIIDWFWKLDDMSRTGDFEHRFGDRSVDYTALLVIGRRGHLSVRERERLKWRQSYVIVNSKFVSCFTLDDLYDALDSRINRLARLS
ncbi:MAG: DUF4263 domain-containing protein [Isosphaeraceae bacterium]|nr:DUF4263 domain-containing protein [Isosphaeraceae bacterium]